MTIRHIMMPHFKCPAVLLATFLAALLTGCDRTESAQSAKATSSSELKAVVSTERGQFTILLRPDLAPVAVANFVNLAEKGFYHGAEVANANAASFSVGNITGPPTARSFPNSPRNSCSTDPESSHGP